jgi:lipid-binding SYLF domain-containing protein
MRQFGTIRGSRREALLLMAAGLAAPWPAYAASAQDIAQQSQAALRKLYATSAKARSLGEKAEAILIFPEIIKAGAVLGGQVGDGAMLRKGRVQSFYRISAASYGLQLGVQKYGYALFFMTPKSLAYLDKSGGWSVGTGLSVVFVDDGFAKPVSSTTLTQDVFAMAFQQKGMMAGSGLEGAKIRQIHPSA